MDLVLFGIQGSGKGTQGKLIAEKYKTALFETGAELRSLSTKKTELGKKVKKIIDAGHLVPTKVVMEIIEDFVKKLPKGKVAVFDGFPRNKEQNEAFRVLMEKLGRDYMTMIIDISKKEAFRRLATRRLCKNCKEVYPAFYEGDECRKCGGELVTRIDDNPESIKNRLNAYMKETMPVIKEYKKQNKLIEIDGEQSIEDVFKDVAKELDKRL